MLTLFSTCKPFCGEAEANQGAAFRNWARLGVDVIIFGGGHGVAGAAAARRFAHVPDIKCNKDGVPYIKAMFRAAETLSQDAILVYTNCDILFDRLTEAVSVASDRLEEFLIVGQRRDFVGSPPSNFAEGWAGDLRKRAHLHSICGIDYFAFTRGLWPTIPAFVVGYPSFDNWLVADALSRNKDVVDATGMILAFHPNHAGRYGGDTKQGVKNRKMATKDYGLANGFTSCAQWTLTNYVLARKDRR